MAHFAKVVNNIVVQVIVAEEEFMETFVDTTPGDWIQTSYNTRGGVHYQTNSNIPSEDQSKALRKNFASVGNIYSKTLDAFFTPRKFNSWTLNEETCYWEPPTPYPGGSDGDGKNYRWNEAEVKWDEITAPNPSHDQNDSRSPNDPSWWV